VEIVQAIAREAGGLPPRQQRQVLDYIEHLKALTGPAGARRSLRGLCADLGVCVSDDDLAEARRELWAGFPREPS
jgi:hypothetical protein